MGPAVSRFAGNKHGDLNLLQASSCPAPRESRAVPTTAARLVVQRGLLCPRKGAAPDSRSIVSTCSYPFDTRGTLTCASKFVSSTTYMTLDVLRILRNNDRSISTGPENSAKADGLHPVGATDQRKRQSNTHRSPSIRTGATAHCAVDEFGDGQPDRRGWT